MSGLFPGTPLEAARGKARRCGETHRDRTPPRTGSQQRTRTELADFGVDAVARLERR